MANNKTNKKLTKPKGSAGKKGKPLKKTVRKSLAKKGNYLILTDLNLLNSLSCRLTSQA